ncbi:CehA/McbA family metallohydrolase [Croceicoccus marinus]|uniref:CehA/McbA family metallohydrolase n=1 Tax=Croceicoccus marinus TaxID=450378 RepID=A0A7G6VZW1_9SPHN|nr:CehA/McbA family metallohydrolase [Croceicoccus marinus]QNE07276.1 CehA/McbA family metallohydrolase [Croceicoccus marinus]
MKSVSSLLALALAIVPVPASAQWEHHYPKVEGYGHQLYLEQEHLPILSSGPVYPAPSPDGATLAFAHQGWLWQLDLDSGVARRLTNAAGIDSRPRWSPDGQRIAFVRDSGSDTGIIVIARGGRQLLTIDTPAIDLDPEFTRDGKALLYTSARAGNLDLWRRDLTTGTDEQLTKGSRVARAARTLADGRLVYQEAAGPGQSVVIRDLHPAPNATGETASGKVLFQQGWMAHLSPDVHPAERAIVYGVGEGNMVRLAVMDVDRPAYPRWLTAPGNKALFPAWSADGSHIYFVEADARQQFHLMRIGAAGGAAQEVRVTRWGYGTGLGDLAIAVHSADGDGGESSAATPIAARVSITRADGHPVTNPAGSTFVDNQNGPVYFYIDGTTKLNLPAGEYRIVATHGPFSLPETKTVRVIAGQETDAELNVQRIWNAHAAGYVSADYHTHLNGSGVNELALPDLLLPMRGEALDYGAPMAWNQYNRFIDADRIGQKASAPDGTTAWLTQEVRSDYHGHIGMIGATSPFQPWFFGPNVPVYGNRDLHNGLVNPFAKAQGALATYVHPVGGDADPFADLSANPLPQELVIDGVLSDGIGLELVCQWTSPLGTAQAWYRFLNIGRAIPVTSGTDMMANFYRLPAIGTARSYLPATDAEDGYSAALDQVRDGRGFVTTGPAILFAIDGQAPGDVVGSGMREWSLDLISVGPVDRVEILVNGTVVQTLEGFEGKGQRTYRGAVNLPAGGWIAARAIGGKTAWPVMSFTHFAHTQPVWIDYVGSTDAQAARAAAQDLLAALDFSGANFRESYGADIPPGLVTRMGEARSKLTAIARE